MEKFIILLLSFVAFFTSCGKNDPYEIPRSINMGFLYDSLEYEQERWLDCGGNHDTTLMRIIILELGHTFSAKYNKESEVNVYDTVYTDPHRMYCTMFGFVPYKQLEFAGKEIEEVIRVEGVPDGVWLDTLHYGYKCDKRGEWFFPFEEFYDSEGVGPDSCQSVYRIQYLLNSPICIVQRSVWKNEKRFLMLRSLVSNGHNTVFLGYQGISGFHWPE